MSRLLGVEVRHMRVYTGGTFDLFHYGHVSLLRQCRAIAGPGGSVTVGLNTDEFVAVYKNRPTVCTYTERALVVGACKFVDNVIPNLGGPDSKPAIEKANPDVLVIGSDWLNKDYHAQLSVSPQWLDERGITIRYVPYTEGISASSIRARLC